METRVLSLCFQKLFSDPDSYLYYLLLFLKASLQYTVNFLKVTSTPVQNKMSLPCKLMQYSET